ncbi:MAG: hypothetical protein P1U40_14395 [Coxiellaceae bacterium]|nr:hypothetical protein [Coxiellaceae bacterium]
MRETRAVVQNTALWGLNSSADCLLYALQQVGAIPHFVHTIKISPHTRHLFANGSRVLLQHLLPLVAAHAIHQKFQRLVYSNPQLNNTDWFNATVGIPMALISIAMTCFHYRHMLAITIKSAILVLDHKKAFHNAAQPQPSAKQKAQKTHEVCRDCTSMRFIKGEVRSYIAYFFMLGVIGVVGGVLPTVVGKPLAFILGCQLYGELFLEYRLADEGVCDRHRSEYFRQNPELSISLGAMLALTCWAVTSTTENYLGIQQDTLDFGIKSLFSLFFLGLTYHMPLPRPIKQSERWLSGLSWLRAGVAFAVDVAADGAKRVTKQELRKQRKQPLHLEEKLKTIAAALNHTTIQKFKPYIIPDFLHSIQNALQDSVLKDYVSEILHYGIDFAVEVRKNKDGWKLKLVKTTPIPKSWRNKLVGNAYGGSRVVGELILALLGSEEVLGLLEKGELKARNILHRIQATQPQNRTRRYVAAPDSAPPPAKPRHRIQPPAAKPEAGDSQWQLVKDITTHSPVAQPEPEPRPAVVPTPPPDTLTVAGVAVDVNAAYENNPFGAPSP